MKKILMLAAAFLLLPLAATAAQYKEGVHYTVVSEGPASAKPEITEFFSFYCPHCYNFEKNVIPKLKARLPEGVAFEQNHVDFIGREMGVEMSRAFATAEVLKVSDKVNHAMFSAIQDKKQHFTNRDDIKALFVANGVDPKQFDSAANSFMVNSMMANMKRNTENAKISGVPALVVNGKYRVETGAIKSYDEMLDIAIYLTQLK
ncbi:MULTISPECIES: thiol:disulfide interchange protein DsbA/DsbL [Shewanella]|jgi:thiol:disulfide interchange protein DsbA|uniref:Thiol:disulfide interchange protein n=1 Tax=Shewanella chilikensis TaxID=558541 RepID=A0A6G7LMN2_9GAMM|nr:MULTISPECIES: thiol:disulfide interchange protein DsbA/DsbL [Shewanella]MBZ4677493.1 disulfide bond formation protein DsbA [Shewanella sp.]MCA0951450.1 thiol:disulfide interchange protein DsbA/DsbL [Shewanella chilikensis]MCE9786586.1 thiol:disulfide interchange protein DsbA/DsbL [Shewanella chilikensis]MCE9852288.1 thiol:disulfide interchange protein DsbA/DsbL [Shewanella chilikensis]MCL1155804.1 thiol:disulfide interchange protein DsbA/DsbL [Shewanella chilikensis]